MIYYPPGTPGPRDTTVPFVCPNCNHKWEAPAVSELGACFLVDDADAFCPECGTEGATTRSEP